MFWVERVFNTYGNVFDAYRINGRRIYDLRAKVAQLHGFHIAQFIDGIGCVDDTWVGSHETIDVCPYLQHFSIQCSCYDAGGVVTTATTQIGCLARVAILADKAWYNSYLG